MDQLHFASSLQNFSLYLTALAGAFTAALWISLVFWTYRDIRSRTRDQLEQILAAVMVGVLFAPGLVIYLILRPKRTLDQTYFETLEEEALLSSTENRRSCPGCGASADPDWLYCPLCYTRLTKQCESCDRQMELSWQLCPYCGTAVPGSRASVKPPPEVSQAPENTDFQDRMSSIAPGKSTGQDDLQD